MYFQKSVPLTPKLKIEQHKMLFERKRISNFSNQKTEFEKFANFSNYFLSNRTNFELRFIEFFELFCLFESIESQTFESNRTNSSLTPPLVLERVLYLETDLESKMKTCIWICMYCNKFYLPKPSKDPCNFCVSTLFCFEPEKLNFFSFDFCILQMI